MEVVLKESTPADCSSSVSLCRVHDIFLSHSGKQKGFARDLYRTLDPLYTTFFDIKQHSLRAGKHFPSHILIAAKTCKVAVVVLSEEFMCSKWTMIELCMFVERRPDIHILPLFYQLQPQDLKLQENLERWNEKWKGYADASGKYLINVAECAPRAVRALCSITGHIYEQSKGRLHYLDIIKSSIATMVEPTVTLDEDLLYGKDRLCKVILDKFEGMLQHHEQTKALVLGLVGPPGSGKSVLSLFLWDCFHRHSTKVLRLPLSEDMDFVYNDDELLKVFKKLLLRLTNFQDHVNLCNISELREVTRLLKNFKLPNSSVCLVIDNIHERSINVVQKILELGVGPGSKVILVSRTLDVLQPVFRMRGDRYVFDCVSMPSLLETEAVELFLHYVGARLGLDACAVQEFATDRHRDIALGIVQTCRLGSEDSPLYLPTDVTRIAEDVVLGHTEDVDHREHELKRVLEGQVTSKIKDCNLEGVRELVLDRFNALPDDEHRILFLDIALFILPANIQSMKKACEVLRLMHECSAEVLQEKIKVLEVSHFVKTSLAGFSVPEVHAQFACSIVKTETWRNNKHVALELSRETISLTDICEKIKVRTLIMQIDVEGGKELRVCDFPNLKAICCLKNCKCFEVVKFPGSPYVGLVNCSIPCLSLSICNCPSLLYVEAPIVRFRIGQVAATWLFRESYSALSSVQRYLTFGRIYSFACSWLAAMWVTLFSKNSIQPHHKLRFIALYCILNSFPTPSPSSLKTFSSVLLVLYCLQFLMSFFVYE